MNSIDTLHVSPQASHALEVVAESSARVWRRAIIAMVLLAVLLLALFAAHSLIPASHISGAATHVISSQTAQMYSPYSGCGAVSLPC